MQTASAQGPLFSEEDIQQMLLQYERQVRMSAAMAQLQAQTFEQVHPEVKPTLKGVPDFPPEPTWWQTMVTIPAKYAVESVKHFTDGLGIAAGIPKLLFTPEGQKLLARLRDVVVNKKDDPTLFRDFMIFITLSGDYGSLLLGVTTDAGLGTGIAALTGVAIPTGGEGKVKWFSGLERSKGVFIEAGGSFLIGRRVEQPQDLTGQFYGYHVGIPSEPDIGSNLYFDTSDDLNYKGFIMTFGIGISLGTATLWGWELVTSD